MIIVNFKTYAEAMGDKATALAEACGKASKKTGQRVISVPTATDLLRLEDIDSEVFSQHVDPVEPGSHTGSTLVENVKQAGATGTLINHSEKRMQPNQIEKAVERADQAGMTTVVCAQDPEECGTYSRFKPDFIAYEPPELIGGDTSVSEAKPELIARAVEESEVPVLTGAGIKTREDVEKSVELGCHGVLVASGVVKSEDTYEEILELCKGL
ncbi:MAG: triose-phosphate isomerase [Candidatus Aenigmatarchaeota archaeon]